MNEVLLSLEEQGFVRRRAHPEHGRIRQTRLTAKGRKLLARCDAEVAEIEARLLCGLSGEERAELRAVLLRGIEALRGGRDTTETAGPSD
jgi:DNA-binding MarR family transcriptional regulator